MANWVPLKEVLQNPDKYGNVSEIPVSYTPDYSAITLNKEETGVHNTQDFETEMYHTWYAALYKDMTYLVSGRVTKQELILRGKTGYKNCEYLQKKTTGLFESETLSTTGENWTEDTIGMLDTLPKHLRKIDGKHWTAIKYFHRRESGFYTSYIGFRIFDSSILRDYDHNIKYALYTSEGKSNVVTLSIRPLLRLPSDILVDVEGIDMGVPLKIRRPARGYYITQETLDDLKMLAKCHMEEANKISDLIKKIKQN